MRKINTIRVAALLAVTVGILNFSHAAHAAETADAISDQPHYAVQDDLNNSLEKPAKATSAVKARTSVSEIQVNPEPENPDNFSLSDYRNDMQIAGGGSTSSGNTDTASPDTRDDEVPTRRLPPTWVDSPPFPSAEWGIGGTPVIGAPDTSDTFPLMRALHGTEVGNFLEKNRIKAYGWSSLGGNLSTSAHSNFPLTYAAYSNRIDLDQLAFNLERIPNTVQRDHIDWGFRMTGFYGIDYRFTISKGLFSGQYLKKQRQYGYDPVLMYYDLYIPKIAQGMNIRMGRFLSIPDIEAQLAPDNYMYTHSLMYGIDVYTQTGVLTSTRLNKNWVVQLGLTAGNDIMPWQRDSKPTGLAGLQWISNTGKDCVYLVADAINDGNYGYNNIQEYVGTWSHAFNRKIHTKTEAWYMYQRNVPTTTLPVDAYSPGRTRIFTNEWAILNYLEFKLSQKDYLTIRNEYMNDIQGQRTGANTQYSSHGLGYVHWFRNWLAFRPEIRYEHAYDNPAYDFATKKNQFLFAADIITRF